MFLTLFFVLCYFDNSQENNFKIAGIIYHSSVSADIFENTAQSVMDAQNISNASSCSQSEKIGFPIKKINDYDNIREALYLLRNSGIHVLISALKAAELTSLSVMTETLRIPHLELDIGSCGSSRNSTCTLHLVNPFRYLPKLIVDVAQAARWKRIVIVVDSVNGKRYTKRILQELSKAGIESVLCTGGDLQSQLWTKTRNVVLLTQNESTINQTIRITGDSPTSRSLNWIVATERRVTNADFIQTVSKLPGNIFLIRSKALYIHTDSWSCYSCTNVGALRVCVTDSQYLKLGNHFQDFELLQFAVHAESPVQVIGEWTPKGRLVTTEYTTPLFIKDSELQGAALRLAVKANVMPYVNLTDGSNDTYHGLGVDIIDDVARIIGFKYVLVEPADGLYGNPLEDGSWTGVINMVMQHEVAFAAGLFTMTTERLEVIDFSIPVMETSLSILTAKPTQKTDIFQFVKPFSALVWICIGILGLTTSIVLMLILYFAESQYHADADYVLSPKDVIFNIISSLTEQGLPSYPTSTSARCLVAFWFIFSILIMAAYTANLAAALTVSTPLKPINSLQDLSEHPELDVIIKYGTNIWTLFETSTDPVLQIIFTRVVKATTLDDALHEVKQGKACYISVTEYLHYLVTLHCQKIRVAKERFQPGLYAMPLPKDSPFKDAIDNSLQVMMETGMIEEMKNKWFYSATYCTEDAEGEDTDHRTNMDRLGGIFLMFCGFLILAGISYIVKHFFLKVKRNVSIP